MAEEGGGLEIVGKAVQAVSKEWSRRGPATRLTRALVERTGARDAQDLLEGISLERIQLDASAAPLVFQAAAEGDRVALEILIWAGRELAGLAIGVIHQLNLEALAFDAVLIGSIHRASPILAQTLQDSVRAVAPHARFVPLAVPPAVGGVLLAMQQAQLDYRAAREQLIRSVSKIDL
jgi:N-acetylglucosamine kinase-like BadF-type ATPase